jgi:endonuclease YncB( thermonuclease family)
MWKSSAMLALLFAANLVGQTLSGPAVAIDSGTLLLDGAKVRLYGLAAPEMRDPLGPQARAALDELIGGRDVSCAVLDIDSHRRAVAACDVAGTNLSEAVLRQGLGTAYRIFTHAAGADPDLAARLDAAEAAARAEGLGIWATTAATLATTWWEDFQFWQIMVPAITAFIGFFAATRYNHHLTLQRDETRRLAAELHAELYWVMRVLGGNVETMEEHCAAAEAKGSDKVNTVIWEWNHWIPPPMMVFEAHVGRLGELPPDVSDMVVNFGGMVVWARNSMGRAVAIFEGPELSLPVSGVRRFVKALQGTMRCIIGLNRALAAVGGVEPHDFARDETKLAAAKKDDGGDAKAAGDNNAEA